MTTKEFKIQYALGTLSDKIKWNLAKNPNTPKEILKILAKDKYVFILNTLNNLNIIKRK